MNNNIEIIHMSFVKVYKFGCATFEHHDYLGPEMLRRKSHNARNYKNVKARQWSDYHKWLKLSAKEREAFRVC